MSLRLRSSSHLLLVVVCAYAAGCGRVGLTLLPGLGSSSRDAQVSDFVAEAGQEPDAGKDFGDAAVADASDIDATDSDAGVDARVFDAGLDADSEPVDAGADDAEAAIVDAGPDAEPDADVDAAVDAAIDAEVDAQVDAGPQCAPFAMASYDHCLDVPYASGALLTELTLDAEPDCLPDRVDIVPVGWSHVSEPLPPGNSARYSMAWHDDGLHLWVEVVDPNRLPAPAELQPWQGDGVELYFDDDGVFAAGPTYDDPGTIQIVVAAPADDVTPVARAQRYRNAAIQDDWETGRFLATPTPTGYVVEAFITAADLDLDSWPLGAAQTIGFDISINVSGDTAPPANDAGVPGDPRLGQYFLQTGGTACGGQPYCETEAFCLPVLGS